jgi:superfamily II DNA/RNA helicase
LNKVEVVSRILQAEGRGLTMIFTRTKRQADRVCEDLDFRGFAVAAVHGDLGQGARERALRAFRNGKIDVLVATDVAARGLDVSGVTHVINYDCPEDPDTYTHRIGRTGRAGATGVAVTFVDWEDMPRWRIIDKTLGLDMPEPPETYHTSPHLFTDLSIPAGVSSTLPTVDRTRAGLGAEVEEDLGGGRRRGRPEQTRPSRTERAPRTRRRREDAPADQPAEEVRVTPDDEAAPRTPRTRRRSRGGSAVAAGPVAAGALSPGPLSPGGTEIGVGEIGVGEIGVGASGVGDGVPLRPVQFNDGTAGAPSAAGDTATSEGAAPRRRRRRGSRGGGASATTGEATATSPDEPA